jgi:T-complex protein 1 subunit eta
LVLMTAVLLGCALPACCLLCAVLRMQSIIRSYRQACALAVTKVKELSVSLEGKGDAEKRELLVKCAETSLNSKLVSTVANTGGGGGCWCRATTGRSSGL